MIKRNSDEADKGCQELHEFTKHRMMRFRFKQFAAEIQQHTALPQFAMNFHTEPCKLEYLFLVKRFFDFQFVRLRAISFKLCSFSIARGRPVEFELFTGLQTFNSYWNAKTCSALDCFFGWRLRQAWRQSWKRCKSWGCGIQSTRARIYRRLS